jgi:hypothetical protein
MNRFAIIAPALSILIPTAALAEDLPNWDVNRAALYESQRLIEFAQAAAKDEGQSRPALQIPPDVLFSRYVAYEAHCLAYLRAHWGDYSEFIQLNAVQEETSSGRTPSYRLFREDL